MMSSTTPAAGSPRTPQHPMGFTRHDVVRGGFLAWCAFIILLLVTLTLTTVVSYLVADPHARREPSSLSSLPTTLVFVAVLGGLVSFVVMLIGLPIGWLIGWAMRGVGSTGPHLVAYAALGAVIGLVAMLVFGRSASDPSSVMVHPFTLSIAVSAVVAVPLGWWRASRRALREDAAVKSVLEG